MSDAVDPEPMSDRRVLVLLCAVLAFLVTAAGMALALLELQDPVWPTGETGTPTDVTAPLVGVLVGGAVVLTAAAATVVHLIRRQLRTARRPHGGRRGQE